MINLASLWETIEETPCFPHPPGQKHNLSFRHKNIPLFQLIRGDCFFSLSDPKLLKVRVTQHDLFFFIDKNPREYSHAVREMIAFLFMPLRNFDIEPIKTGVP